MPKKKERRGGVRPSVIKYKNKSQKRKAHNEQAKEWHKENTFFVNVRYNLENDKDILDKLASLPSKIDYLRELVRNDIANEKTKKEEA